MDFPMKMKKPSAGMVTLLAALLLTAWRIFVTGRVPLTADEAYFWQWSRTLAWCYHDQPPLIAWLTALTARLAGATETGVRLSGPLLSAAAAWALYRLGKSVSGNAGIGAAAALLFLCAPLFGLGAMMLTVENPLALTWVLAMLFSFKALETGRAAWWCAAGAAFGLGMLSKYNIVLALPCLGLFFLLSPRHRPALKKPGPWLGLVVSLVLFWPVIQWNARHDWANFRLNFLGRRDFSPLDPGALNPAHLLEYPAGQALALSPFLFGFLVWAMWRSLREGAGAGGDWRKLFLFCFSAPVFLFYALAGFTDTVALHWPATGYLAAMVALPLAAAPIFSGRGRKGRAFRALAVAGAVLMFLQAALVHILPAFPGPVIARERAAAEPGEAGTVETFYARWPVDLGREVVAARDSLARKTGGEKPVFILCRGFSTAAYLAFYAPGQPETLAVFQLSPQGQDHLYWQDLNARRGHHAIFVIEHGDRPVFLEKIGAAFESIEAEPIVRLSRDGRRLRDFELWRCYNFLGLPEGDPPHLRER